MEKNKIGASKSILIYSVGTVSRQLVGFIMLPVYTRYLMPEDYGVVALLMAFLAIFELVLGARFAQQLPRYYYETDNKNLVVSTAVTITGIFSLLGLFIAWSFSDAISVIVLGEINYSNHIAIFSLLLFTTGIENYGLMYLRLIEKPYLFLIASLSKLFIQLILNIYFIIYLDLGVYGVIYSAVIASSVLCLIFLGVIYTKCGFEFDKSFVIRLFKYSWPLWVGGFLSLYTHTANKYLIRFFSGLNDVGLFELAGKFAIIQTILIFQPFQMWWSTERFRIFNSEEEEKVLIYQKVFDFFFVFLLSAMVGISIFSNFIIEIMASKEFHESVQSVKPLSLSILFFNLSLFFNFSFLATDKTLYIAYLKIITAIILTGCSFLLIPEFGFQGAAFASLITNIIVFYLTFYWGKKKLDLGIKLNFFYSALFFALIVLAADTILKMISYSMIQEIIAGILFMLLYIVIAVFLLKKNSSTSNITIQYLSKVKLKGLMS